MDVYNKRAHKTIFNRQIVKPRALGFFFFLLNTRVDYFNLLWEFFIYNILLILKLLEKSYSPCFLLRDFCFSTRGTIDSYVGPLVSVAWNFIITLYRIAERYCEGVRGEEEGSVEGSGGLAEWKKGAGGRVCEGVD